MIWHKIYSASARRGFPEKAVKDRLQAATLAAALTEHDSASLLDAFRAAPKKMQVAARTQRPLLEKLLGSHEEARALIVTAMD